MADKIRLGFVGANVRSTWASQSHFPALLASPDVELTAVCTTRPESAEAVPERFVYVPADFPRGDPFNVGQMYALFAAAIRTGHSRVPTFDTAVDLHRFLDTIMQASETGRALPVA